MLFQYEAFVAINAVTQSNTRIRAARFPHQCLILPDALVDALDMQDNKQVNVNK